jgi:DNA-binding NarL/FixJ family response regulator
MQPPGTLQAMNLPDAVCCVGHKDLRVFLVEDSPGIRERLYEMLASIDGARTVGYAASAGEAIRGILETHPDAVVLDIGLEQGSGFDVLRAVRAAEPATAFYVLTNYASEPYRRLAQRLGADEFFDKSSDLERVRQTLAEHARKLN